MKKVDYQKLMTEEFQLQPYFKSLTVTNARTFFASESGMMKHVKLNFSHDPKYSNSNWVCENEGCNAISSNSHLMWCPGYQTLRIGKDIEKNPLDLIKYFQEIIKIRDKADNRSK